MVEVMVNIEQFREYLSKRNLRAVSIDSYVRDVEQFCKYLEREGVTEMSRVTERDVRRYCEYMTRRGLAPVSMQRKIASLKQLFDHLSDMGQASLNPAVGVHIGKRSAAKTKALTGEQVSQLLAAPDVRSVNGVRDRTMFALIYSTGIKVSELISLRVADLRLSEKSLALRRHGEEIALPLDEDVCCCLGAYLALRDMLSPKEDDTLFLNVYGQRITRQGVWKTLKKYADIVGIEGITLETIRRSFAQRYVDSGNDIRELKDILGHSDISITRAYIKN
jgi:integrase/recombinase XerD